MDDGGTWNTLTSNASIDLYQIVRRPQEHPTTSPLTVDQPGCGGCARPYRPLTSGSSV
jgi:hypothetical protein